MKNGQLRIIGGAVELRAEVRGIRFDVWIGQNNEAWEWTVEESDPYSEQVSDTEKTYAAAFRAAMRACDGMAPFRKHERGAK